jgi:catechol 2,3-dioxygenase-like lactoylglutathione lyase family enzyme
VLSRSRVCASLPYEGLASAPGFYVKKLGLKKSSGSVSDCHMEFAAGDGTVIQLFESDSAKSEDTAATFEVADLAKVMAALRKKGVRFEEYDLPGIKTVDGVASMGGHRAAWVKDPGGNVLALHQCETKRPRGKARKGGSSRRS